MVTLDIEDTSIKMMVVRGRRVETAMSLPLEPGLVHNGVIIDTATVSRHIVDLLSGQGQRQRHPFYISHGQHT
jgi:Tfp pilus assembly PilM family ATPase